MEWGSGAQHSSQPTHQAMKCPTWLTPALFAVTALLVGIFASVLARMGQVLNALTPAESSRVRGLFISIDPERDTPQRIADYARFFHPSIIGLTGTPDDLHRVTKQYLVLYQKAEIGGSQVGYLMDHSTKTYLIGRDGYLAKVLGHELEASQILAAVRDVLMSDA